MSNTLFQIAEKGNPFAIKIYNEHHAESKVSTELAMMFILAISVGGVSSLAFVKGMHIVGYIGCSMIPIPLAVAAKCIHSIYKARQLLKIDKNVNLEERKDLEPRIRGLKISPYSKEALDEFKQAARMSDKAVE